ncbi:MAG: DegT/DnrJ/EryC1/StrS family aminotransferase, partial [Pseudomonadota bacterium]
IFDWMPEPDWSYATHWLTACTLRPGLGINSAEFIRRLAAELIEARPLWKPMHLQPVFTGSSYFADGDVSVSDRLFEQGVCLPSGSNMSETQIERVVDTIRKVLK